MSVDNLRQTEYTVTYSCSTFCVLFGHLLSDVYLVATAVETYKVVKLARRGRA
jgi:hypothetical protein